jgi:hypothetical protein
VPGTVRSRIRPTCAAHADTWDAGLFGAHSPTWHDGQLLVTAADSPDRLHSDAARPGELVALDLVTDRLQQVPASQGYEIQQIRSRR